MIGQEPRTAGSPCRLCGAPDSVRVATVHGAFSDRDFELRRCPSCSFAFISDPWTDFARIYDDRYYAGQGADPLVDYTFELEQPERTIRQYEWRGIALCIERIIGRAAGVRWLDFGCGNGGLVRWLRANTDADAVGLEDGSIAARARGLGIPILSRDELAAQEGAFGVVTAIEVIEHTLDPIAELRAIRRLLRPGGLLFLTTGNAAPYAERLDRWSYVVPEIHVSFFEPATLEYALREAGFRPERRDPGPGFDQILKFKVLKNLRIRRRSRLTDALPARALAAVVEPRTRLRDHPLGWAH